MTIKARVWIIPFLVLLVLIVYCFTPLEKIAGYFENNISISKSNINFGWSNDDKDWNIAQNGDKINNKISYVDLKEQHKHDILYDNKNGNPYKGTQINDYFGRSEDNPNFISSISKYSEVNSFTFGFMAQGTTDGEYGNTWKANYLDQIQEVKSYNKEVWLAFGGWVFSSQLYLSAPDSQYIYNALLNLCLGYDIYNLDFDFEASSTPGSSKDIERLTKALGELQYVLKLYFNKQLKVRVTLGYLIEKGTYHTFIDYLDPNYLYWNDMRHTSILNTYNNIYDNDPLGEEVKNDTDTLLDDFYSPLGKRYDAEFIHRHLEFTYAYNNMKSDNSSWSDIANSATKNHLHSLSIWDAGHDHPNNSVVDRNPTDFNDSSLNDYYFENLGVEGTDMNKDNYGKYSGDKMPSHINNISLYSHTSIGDVFTWSSDIKDVDYYIIEDKNGNVLTKSKNNKAGVLTNKLSSTNDDIYIVAVNKNGESKTEFNYKNQISSNKKVLDEQLWDYDANVQYSYIKNVGSMVKYVYYKGNVYENIANDSINPNSGTPDINKNNWKLIKNPFLTQQQEQDLSNFEYDTFISSQKDVVNYNITPGENTSKYISKFNVTSWQFKGITNNGSNFYTALFISLPILAVCSISLGVYLIKTKKFTKIK